ncbi:hypothetical protein [Neisseria meningitidis]|uniref:hypothetical protein n=1 Tax=Neisseria meningitidis TaxID=487 RepID=UPI0011CE4BC4|nr:hypothetical protein [Neisseria meningitidis]MDO6017613.1 hypothetical protein [Neisseria gonorrhoeae]
MMLTADIRQHLTPNFTAIYVEFFALCGQNSEAALVLANLFGWSEWLDNHRPKKQGWITKTAEDFANELKLTRHKYEKARECLLEMGLIEYKRAGVFGKMAYRLCREKLLELIYAKVRGMSKPEFQSAFHTDKDGYHIPRFIPLHEWNEFLKMRENKSKSKQSLVAEQKKQLIRQLTNLRKQKFDLKNVMQKSLISGWAGFYRPDKSAPSHAPTPNSSAVEYEVFMKQQEAERKRQQSKKPRDLNTVGRLNLLKNLGLSKK